MRLLTIFFCFIVLAGCENADMMTANDAGLDALKAATLSDKDVQEIAAKSVQLSDKNHAMAPPESKHSKRLIALVRQQYQDDGLRFNYAVYVSPEVNAFAMADGTIRIYSGYILDDLDLKVADAGQKEEGAAQANGEKLANEAAEFLRRVTSARKETYKSVGSGDEQDLATGLLMDLP